MELDSEKHDGIIEKCAIIRAMIKRFRADKPPEAIRAPIDVIETVLDKILEDLGQSINRARIDIKDAPS